jgi:hypothetical protein
MPFTLSHPAAAAVFWPLVRRGRLPLSALVVGTMTPDFEFFLRLRPLSLWSHSLVGLVAFCLPVGLLVLAAWEWVAREPVRDLLGLRAEPRTWPPGAARGWWLRAAAAVLVGAVTHLTWDGFTHGGYWGAELVPALREPAFQVDGRGMPWFNLLQHASTLVGGLVVAGWLVREARHDEALHVVACAPWRWLVLAACGATAATLGLWNGARAAPAADYWTAQLWLGRAAVGAVLGLALALFAYGLARRGARPAAAGAPGTQEA